MCTLCAATQTFDPIRHPDTGSDPFATPTANPTANPTAGARVTEGSDAAANVSTIYGIQVGDTFEGDLGSAGDRDWVAVTLEAGQSYEIGLSGAPGGGGTLSDPYLRLYDANGDQVALNDDGGVGYDSALTFTATTTATYYIAAGAYDDASAGSYEISVNEVLPPQEATLDELADYLTDGYWNDQGFSGFRFDTSASNQITVNLTNLTAAGQQLARWALEAWEMIANLDFVEVTGSAQINFDDNRSGAFAGADSVVNGFAVSSSVNVGTGWLNAYGTTLDSYSFSTYIHEIGHALGLGHQGNYNGSATYGVDETFANDSWQLSIMSYFSQTNNTTTNASYAELLTAMMADIVAIQNLYGAPGASTATAGNTSWGANSNFGNYLDDLFTAMATGNFSGNYTGGPVAFTIYDQSGNDTMDLSFQTSNDRISLLDGTFSDIGGLIGNVGIARGTIIENVIAGSGNDTVTGNGAANRISGEDGNDSLFGGIGFDTLFGGEGNDTINGGNGRDTAWLGNGNDTYTDTAQTGGLAADRVFAGNGNDRVSGGGGNDTVLGGNGNDTLDGDNGNDQINGGNQGDLIRAGNGNDVVEGGNGRDTVFLGNGNDTYTDTAQTGWLGGDRIFAGNGNDDVNAGGGNDTVIGAGGNDTLAGAGGNDLIDGGSGFDRIFAGTGNDTVRGGDGRDTAYLGTGNDIFEDNAQSGWWGADEVFGGAGNDTINAGGGNDTLTGGGDNDTFVFSGTAIGQDVITDFTLGPDQLQLDDALWGGGLSKTQLVTQLASVTADGVLFDFGNGNTILLEGLTSTAGLAAEIDFI